MFQKPVPDSKPDPIAANEDAMTNINAAATRSIFRAEALERYIQNQERAVFPRLVSPRSFRRLWLLAILLMAVGALIAFWPILAPLLEGLP